MKQNLNIILNIKIQIWKIKRRQKEKREMGDK